MLVSASVIVFAGIYGLEPVQFAILIIAMGFVIVCEMLNTSIEALVDLETPAYHSLARIAKDVAAGAVLVSSITAVCVGIALFFNLKLWETLLIILSSPVYLVVFAVLITFGTVFVFKGTEMFKSKKK
ncbi:MAG: diacylglycerol kinase [Oscillospiraceae bacterium]|nr:diacylglycerol kinase [Oscillospiraceae bacterium]